MNIKDKGIKIPFTHQVGVPFYPFGTSDPSEATQERVMPSQFSFPTVPMACTFIRNLNYDGEYPFI